MTTFHRRADIGLRPPNAGHVTPRSTEEVQHSLGLTIHWTGAGGKLFKPDPAERLRGIQAYHVDKLGYGDIAYNGAFDADGNTYELRSPVFVSAHAASFNNNANRYTDGIVFLEDERGFTQGATVALAWWADLFRFTHGRAPHLWSHHAWAHFGGIVTECCGPYLSDVVKYLGGTT